MRFDSSYVSLFPRELREAAREVRGLIDNQRVTSGRQGQRPVGSHRRWALAAQRQRALYKQSSLGLVARLASAGGHRHPVHRNHLAALERHPAPETCHRLGGGFGLR